ncbi:DUF3482 domain-containing protein [Aliikangiella marina]|uniref:DUF3482 domain-containing protein n=1 Tax=Aliikangiella marina TaxID=1712262 RepID=A0A545T9X0_9GAMM|nr:DUF3482 domain-containing protein [Aliikangiella marina]TQV74010.1 DUF3482 domain-containing protein [Aliikangiella marina]
MKRAAFAVIGHPNKGKSSIVSTLARNDEILISPQSGTTVEANRVRIETENAGYELIDTPGFQRPTQVLKWLKQRANSADQRAAAVAEFVSDSNCQENFPDEVQLLKPVIDGAAILYVVDGSRPYGAEYESEMEILRWTGRPSMALINPIEGNDYVDEWSSALAQYFKTVRVFNPMLAEFAAQIELLTTFAHLNPEWSNNIENLTADLKRARQTQRQRAAIILARLLQDLCDFRASQKVLDQAQAETIQPILVETYQNWMKATERKAIEKLFALYQHFHTPLEIDQLELPPDLFDCEQWYAWGLNKKQLVAAAAVAGMAAGAAADLVVAGSSFMLGAIGGGILGGGTAWFGADKLLEIKLKGLPLGGYEASYGPISNRNFPYVIIGRFLFLYQQISRRNHAVRDTLTVNPKALQLQIDQLESSQKKAIHQVCEKLSKQKVVEDLDKTLAPLFSE